MKTLSVGMAFYDDYDGVFFTINSLLLGPFKEIIKEIIIIDNNPTSQSADMVRLVAFDLRHIVKYVPFTEKISTSVRDEIFKHASGDYVMVLDCHILIDQSCLPKMIDFLNMPVSQDMFHGVNLGYNLQVGGTDMVETWRICSFGNWRVKEGVSIDTEPFEIRLSGLGLFLVHRESWLGFNKHFVGWGGEEGYIHEKYRRNGRKVILLPWLRLLHRFSTPVGTTYTFDISNCIRNHAIGWIENERDVDEVRHHFSKRYDPLIVDKAIEEARLLF